MRLRVFAVMMLAVVPLSIAGAEETVTLQQVNKTAQAGNLDEARRMVDVLLADKPGDAKVHFVKADICASLHDIECVRKELKAAKSIDSGLRFANPQAVMDLEALADGRPSPRQRSKLGLSKGWLIAALAGTGLLAWALLKRKKTGLTRAEKTPDTP
jgi:hypothetical protein